MASTGRRKMANDLDNGRECFERGAWTDAYAALRVADHESPLDGIDLERLGVTAYLVGREREFEQVFDRLHRLQVEKGERQAAARSAFWVSLSLLLRGEGAQSNAWVARGMRLVDGVDCAERGYLMAPTAERQLHEGRADLARETAMTAARVGEACGDADLVAIARHIEARALIQLGRVADGLQLLDETMLPVIAGDLGPVVTGLLYCSVLDACRQVHALARAREWTAAFSRWCERHSEALAFSNTCLVNRAEVLRFHGAWLDALADAGAACERAARANRKPPAAALYQRGEVYRLRGDQEAAEEAFRAASQSGGDPQPGLALLRMAQGDVDGAGAMMRRIVKTTADPFERARLLPAHVEVLLALGAVDEARAACRELGELAGALEAEVLRAAAAYAEGAIALADGAPDAALIAFRRAFGSWTRLGARYELGRVRALIGLACRALGDEETAQLELAAARDALLELEARAELARLDRLDRPVPSGERPSLSPREREVLRLIAAGCTNKVIAARLSVSERTVDRHVSNILGKLDVSSRTAATAFAYEHGLV